MSSLPKSVGVPHRRAHREHARNLPSTNQPGGIVVIDTGSLSQAGKTTKQKGRDELGGPDVKPKYRSPRESKKTQGPDVTLKSIDPSAFNTEAEKLAVELLATRMAGKLVEDGEAYPAGPMKFNSACDWLAFRLRISVETAKRYIRKFSADDRKATFILEGGCVLLKERKS